MSGQPVALGRRGVLGVAAVGAVLAARPHEADATPARRATRRHAPVTVPDDPALHALRRLAYGPTPQDLATVRKQGVAGWFRGQLAQGSDPRDALIDATVPFLSLPPPDAAAAYLDDVQTAVQAYEWTTLLRTIFTGRQVEARLTEVWLDHFNVCSLIAKPFLPWTRFTYDTNVVRPRATGSFAALLQAVLVSPAMLTYLDQWLSTKSYPIENLARENLELHTVGLGHFTERDVKAYAKLLTGATIDPKTWEYRYEPSIHYTGRLEVLGFKTTNRSANGERLVGQFAEYLAHRPETARNVARRLLVHYVSDSPSTALVDRVARQYLRHGTDIGQTLGFIIEQPEFFASRGAKIRRPGDYFAAAVRGLSPTWLPSVNVGPATQPWLPLLELLRGAGHAPSEWPAPNGYPQTAAAWLNSNTTMQQWRFASALVDSSARAVFFDRVGPAAEAWRPGITYDGVIAAAARHITGQSVRVEHRRAIADLAGLDLAAKPLSAWRLGGTAAHQAIEFGILASEYMTLR
jgi:uncharacterized protein (DUF1800 family)